MSIEKQYRNVRVRDENPIALSLGIQTPNLNTNSLRLRAESTMCRFDLFFAERPVLILQLRVAGESAKRTPVPSRLD